MAKRILFVVDRVMLAEQSLNDGFSLISKEYSAIRITSSNYKQYKNAQIHIIVVVTLENIYQNIPSTFYDLIIVDNAHSMDEYLYTIINSTFKELLIMSVTNTLIHPDSFINKIL
jgi:type I site-specific restriction endonuclease